MPSGSPGRIGATNSGGGLPSSPRMKQSVVNAALVLGMCGALLLQFVLLPLLVSQFYYNHESSSSTIRSMPGQQPHQRQQHGPTEMTTFRRKQMTEASRKTDGTLNGAPIYLIEHDNHRPFTSAVHCVGENYQPNGWMQRSCHFANLCLNVTSGDYVVVQGAQESLLMDYVTQDAFWHVSDTLFRYGSNVTDRNRTQAVAIGGLNKKWGPKDMRRLEWFPHVLEHAARTTEGDNDRTAPNVNKMPQYYYMLPDNVVMIPYHSMNGANPGHLVWDDFLPIYTLLDMFQLTSYEQLWLRRVLPIDLTAPTPQHERGLWASCDWRDDKREICAKMMRKFGPLMTGRPALATPSTNRNVSFVPRNPRMRTDLVCAAHAVAGIGAVTDHGTSKSHGWEEADYMTTHNHGRGGQFFAFRNYMLTNIGISTRDVTRTRPHKIVFSQKSSDIGNRNIDFTAKIALVQKAFGATVDVQSYVFKYMTLYDQIKVSAEASIFVGACGGGAVNAMFLPRGASVFVYFVADGGAQNNRRTYKPARLDWDLFNAMSHLRVHWIPRGNIDDKEHDRTLLLMIQHELQIIESGRLVS